VTADHNSDLAGEWTYMYIIYRRQLGGRAPAHRQCTPPTTTNTLLLADDWCSASPINRHVRRALSSVKSRGYRGTKPANIGAINARYCYSRFLLSLSDGMVAVVTSTVDYDRIGINYRLRKILPQTFIAL